MTRSARPLERAPAGVSRVERGEIQGMQPAVGLEESLALVPGVLVSNRHNFAVDSRIAIRGFGAGAGFGVRGVRLLLDGIPLTMPDGQATLNNVAPGMLGRIEVIRGPTSALWGNAAGGVISLETESAEPAPLAFETRLLAGGQGTGDVAALRKLDLKGSARSAGGSIFLGLSRLRMSGFREHSRTEHTVFTGRVGYAVGRNSAITVVLNAADMPVAENPGSLPLDSALLRPEMAWPANVRQDAGKTARQVQGGATYTRNRGDGRTDLTVYGLDRSMVNPLPFAIIGLDRRGGGLRATHRDVARIAGREVYVTGGLDLELQRDDRREFANLEGVPADSARRNQMDRVHAVGPFAQAQVVLGPGLELHAGARFDVVDFRTTDRPLDRLNPAGRDESGRRRLSAPSATLGLIRTVRPGLDLYVNTATSFQTPTTTELINAPPDAGTGGAGFNPDLQPERARSAELGARGRWRDRVAYEIAVYTMSVLDKLVPFQVPEEPGRNFYRNAARARHQGIEAAVSVRAAPGLTLDAAYTYSDFEFRTDELRDVEGNRIPGTPPHRWTGRARFHPGGGAVIELAAERVAAYFTDDLNLHTNPAYTVLDLRLGYEYRRGEVRIAPFLGVNNLLDRRYNSSVVVNAVGDRYYEPAPGRNLYLGLRMPARVPRDGSNR